MTSVNVLTVWYACLDVTFQDWPSIPASLSVSAWKLPKEVIQVIHRYVLTLFVNKSIESFKLVTHKKALILRIMKIHGLGIPKLASPSYTNVGRAKHVFGIKICQALGIEYPMK